MVKSSAYGKGECVNVFQINALYLNICWYICMCEHVSILDAKHSLAIIMQYNIFTPKELNKTVRSQPWGK